VVPKWVGIVSFLFGTLDWGSLEVVIVIVVEVVIVIVIVVELVSN
jgi:hypothetical protein